MRRLILEITEQRVECKHGECTYSLRGNGIKFAQKIKETERTPENMKLLNESFANSLRIIKHFGGYVRDGTSEIEMKKMLNSLSSTNTGIAIKVKNDDLKNEFQRFSI